ncbi:MAG: DUF3841 domain-containing protein [Candidatus Spechtbacterales bacterium]
MDKVGNLAYNLGSCFYKRKEVFKLSEEITLRTVQHVRDWEELQRVGILRRNEVDFPGRFSVKGELLDLYLGKTQLAYAFMVNQMRKRIAGCSVQYPIWAWYKHLSLSNLTTSPIHSWLYKGEGISIEFKISRDKVLLSDLQPWSKVLSNDYIALDSEEYSEFKKREKKYKNDPVLGKEIEAEIVKSWERVFDLEAIETSDYHTYGGVYVQACVEEIRKEQVVLVESLQPRF